MNLPPLLADNYADILRDIGASGEVRVFAATWNQQGRGVPSALDALLPVNRFHLYAVGTQECSASAASSAVFAPSMARWEAQLTAAVGADYDVIASASLGASHLAIFAHRALRVAVTDCQRATVACGFAGVLTNKGAVLASLCIGNTSILFVNAHLSAYQHQVAARNAGYHHIEAAAPLAPSLWRLETRMAIRAAADSRQAQGAYARPLPASAVAPAAAVGSAGSVADVRSGALAAVGVTRSTPATAASPALSLDAALASSARTQRVNKMHSSGGGGVLPLSAGGARDEDEDVAELVGEPASAPLPVAPETAVTARFDRVIWLGDLNYRVDCSRAEADAALLSNDLSVRA